MPAWGRSFKIVCEKCGTSVTKEHLSRYKSRCSGGSSYCPKCPNFHTKSGHDLYYHIARKDSAAVPKNNHAGKKYSIEFPSFRSLRHRKQLYQTAETTSSGGKSEMQCLADARDDKSLEEEIRSCRHFWVDSEIQKGRYGVFNFVVSHLTARLIEEKLDRVLHKLKCEAKLNLALGFILKNIEDRKVR